MMKGKKIFLLLALLLSTLTGFSQNVEMADKMRSNGRIYVVVAVVVTILAGLIFYVARLDRKMTKLEKEK